MEEPRRPVAVEVRPAIAPDKSLMVLLQLEDGYVLLPPEGAREVALRLTLVAEEVEKT